MNIDFDYFRILSSFCVGILLCLSGSLTQHATQNNIAGPSTLGFDGVAVFFVIISYFFLELLPIQSELLSFILFILTYFFISIFIKFLSFKNIFSLDIKYLVLLGLCFNLFIGAIFSVVQFLFMSMNLEFPTGLWFGNFRFVDQNLLFILIPLTIIFYFLSLTSMKGLRILSLGEGITQNFNLNTHSVKNKAMKLSLIATSLIISFYGVFSFLSLIAPLLIRRLRFFRGNIRREFIFGSLLSGLFLSVIDFFCYNFIFMGMEFPVGMISSIIGSFLLIFLLLSQFKK